MGLRVIGEKNDRINEEKKQKKIGVKRQETAGGKKPLLNKNSKAENGQNNNANVQKYEEETERYRNKFFNYAMK